MSDAYLAAVATRRTNYAITAKSSVSDEKLEAIVKQAVLHSPTSFNIQSSRAVLVLGAENTKLWNLVSESFLKGVPDDKKAAAQARLTAFAGGYGSVLFFEDQAVIDDITAKIPIYTTLFPVWSTNAAGILQSVVWTSLTLEGLGASLQHFGADPAIAAEIHKAFNLPTTWTSTAIMPFGDPAAPPAEKTFTPIENRVKVVKA